MYFHIYCVYLLLKIKYSFIVKTSREIITVKDVNSNV